MLNQDTPVHGFNFQEAAKRLLPPLLRKPKTLAWLNILLSPMGDINLEWKTLHHEILASYRQRQMLGAMQQYLNHQLYPSETIGLQNSTEQPGNITVTIGKSLNNSIDRGRIEQVLLGYGPPGLQVIFLVSL